MIDDNGYVDDLHDDLFHVAQILPPYIVEMTQVIVLELESVIHQFLYEQIGTGFVVMFWMMILPILHK